MRQSWKIAEGLARKVTWPVPVEDVLQSLCEEGVFDRWLYCDGTFIVESSRKLDLLMERMVEHRWHALDGAEKPARKLGSEG